MLARDDNPEEYMVVIPPGGASGHRSKLGRDTVQAEPDSLTIVPPGKSRITAREQRKSRPDIFQGVRRHYGARC